MTLVQFLRLIQTHIKLLIISPLVIGLITFICIDDSSLQYSTSSKLYTGFASGYSIKNNARRDFYAIKTKFDNFFESIKSRSTQEEIILKSITFYLSQENINDRDMSIENQVLFNEIFTKELRQKVVIKNDSKKHLNYYRKNTTQVQTIFFI